MKMIIGSILIAILIMLLPATSAVEFNTAIDANEEMLSNLDDGDIIDIIRVIIVLLLYKISSALTLFWLWLKSLL